MKHLGDFDTSTVVYGKFSTFRPSTGATYTLAGTPVLSVYKDNSTTQTTTGVTLTADFDSVTGLNHFAVDTSTDGTFYAAGSFFDIVITTGTVDSVSVTGAVVGSFTLRKNSALKPTTAGRTLDISAGGEAGVDWANVGSPTTTVTLSGTTVKTATDVETDTADIQTRLPAALVSGRIDASVGAMATDVITNTALASSAVTEIQAGLSTLDAAGIRAAVGLASANLDTQLAAIVADTGELQTDLVNGGRLDLLIDGIKAKTDNLPASPAAVSDLITQAGVRTAVGLASANLDTQLSAIAGYIDTEVAAIKTKTDNLPASPAGQVAIKKNTALPNFTFSMVDSSDHVTPKTGLTITAQRKIDSGALASCANAASEVSGGLYVIDLDAADLNGDIITLKFSASGADTTYIRIRTQA